MRDAVSTFLNSAKQLGQAGGIDPIVQNRIVLAIDEAVANIIEHGFPEPGSLANAQIHLTMRHDADSLEFEIRDNGIPFNPLEKKSNVELYYEEGLEGGIGLLALTALDCQYERSADQNILRIRRPLEKAST